jgi:hypothetical protein
MQIKKIGYNRYKATEAHNNKIMVHIHCSRDSAMVGLLSRLDACGYFCTPQWVKNSVHEVF